MPSMPHQIRTIASLMMLTSMSVLMSACSLTDILTGVDTHYQIDGSSDDQATQDYLKTILDERLTERTKTLSDDQEERARQEDYIEQTIRADLLKALRAKGYYSARVQYQDGNAPLSGDYKITYGPQYTIASLDVVPGLYDSYLNRDKVHAGDVLDAQAILTAQGELYNKIQKGRCYFSLSVENDVYLNREDNSGDVELVVEAGREGKFGSVVYQGNASVRDSYLRKLVPWKEGDCFRREKLEDYKTVLLQSGLFAKADIVLPDEPNEEGQVPVTMDLRERAHRSISAGLTYYSDEGPGAVFGWEHRNLLGSAEKLTAELGVSSLKQSLDLDFTKPYFLRNDQTLSLSTSIRRQDTDAYQELAIDFGGEISRNFTKHLTGSTGVSLSISEIDDEVDNETKTYGLVSFPQKFTYDTRNDTLEPTKGVNITGGAEPFIDAFGESDPFIKTQLTGSTYLSLNPANSLVLAGKAGFGSIWGADIENIPATQRFYAGGGGSVRGYGYQEVGPQLNGDPTGGLSLVNFSLEMRSKFTDKFGGVVFVDGANVSEESTPNLDQMAIGTGIGVRYYTGFGPIRFDIATPLTQEDDLDRNYQFYISIGQAF